MKKLSVHGKCCWALLLVSVFAILSGCGKPSPYIRFGEIHPKSKVGDEQVVSQYIVFTDTKTNLPIGGLTGADLKVNVGGREVPGTLLPSASDLGIALVIEQGGSKAHFEEARRLADIILVRLGAKKFKAAILGADGATPTFQYEDPGLASGKLNSLKSTGKPCEEILNAISLVNDHGMSGLKSTAKRAIIAIVSGVPTKAKASKFEEGVPVVVIDIGNTDNAAFKSVAESSGGLYIRYGPNQSVTAATRAISQIELVHAHTYSLSFKIKQSEWPLKYSLTLNKGEINTTGDYVSEELTKRMVLVIGIVGAILVIVIVVLVFKRKPAQGPEISRGAGWTETGRPAQNASSSYDDDDATRAGTDAYSPGKFQNQGYSQPSPQNYSQPSGPYGGGLAPSAGDVTSGAMDVVQQPTYGGGSAPSAPNYSSYSGDATVGDIQAVPSMSGGSPSGVFAPLILSVESGPASGREIRVSDRTKLGRGDAYAHSFGSITFPSDPRISREHSELIPENRGGATFWSIANRSTTNQTYVNDSAITGNYVLKYNDRIRLGETNLRVQSAPAADGDSTMR